VTGARELAIAVVGLGFGANHARVLGELEGVRLAAVCDRDETKLATITARDPSVATYTDFNAMLTRERLDAVIVAVPAHLHAPVTRAAIAAGCAVLVEKPMATSLDEGRSLIEAATSAGVTLIPAHIERFNPAVQALARCVREGAVGKVLQVSARRLAYFMPRGRDVDVGVVHDLAYHDVDMLRFIVGAEVDRAFAETHSNIHTPYEDAINAVLRFDSGTIGTIEVNWLSPRKVRDLTVLGERGLLVAEYADFRSAQLTYQPSQHLEEAPALDSGSLVNLRGDEPPPARSIAITAHEPLREELADFVSAVRDRTPPAVTAADALATLAIVDALTESARTGVPVAPARE
jgi:predicted dehydrogenase